MRRSTWLSGPYILWMAIFTIIPLGVVVWFAFTDGAGHFTLDNVLRLGDYLPIFLRSVWMALAAALICLVIGYPAAYYIAGRSPMAQRFLYMLIMLVLDLVNALLNPRFRDSIEKA